MSLDKEKKDERKRLDMANDGGDEEVSDSELMLMDGDRDQGNSDDDSDGDDVS